MAIIHPTKYYCTVSYSQMDIYISLYIAVYNNYTYSAGMKERCRDGCRTSLLIAGVVLVPNIFHTLLPPCHPYITTHFMEMIFSTCIIMVQVCMYECIWYVLLWVFVYYVVVVLYKICSTCVCICMYVMCSLYFTQNWRKLNKSGDVPWPEERSSHAACCLNYGQQFPQLLVSGGLDRQRKPLADLWILDIERGNWRKVRQTFLHFLLCVWFVYEHYVFL